MIDFKRKKRFGDNSARSWIVREEKNNPGWLKAIYERLGFNRFTLDADKNVAAHLHNFAPKEIGVITRDSVRYARYDLGMRAKQYNRNGNGKQEPERLDLFTQPRSESIPIRGGGLNEIALNIAVWRERKGFITPEGIDPENKFELSEAEAVLVKLMLVCSEIAEASEAVRKNDEANFREELADAVIRLLDICGTMGIDIEFEIDRKMKINAGRPERHGKATAI